MCWTDDTTGLALVVGDAYASAYALRIVVLGMLCAGWAMVIGGEFVLELDGATEKAMSH